ncbi:MAG: DUF3516 domain-containing protein [Myxococcota bacterium]|nr:DUF3516 domain-containing protein [Myxococcota bacterium]
MSSAEGNEDFQVQLSEAGELELIESGERKTGAPKTLGALALEPYEEGEDLTELLFDRFLEWTLDREIELYPAQEEGVLEVMSDRHVILNTPTGSGKSMVALGMHFWALARGLRSVYTSPSKALVSEKFFDLCRQFGARNVGMLTGDASINGRAPIICCTAEILAAQAISEGDLAGLRYVVMDEFHYYGDRDRGIAWQLPLLTLRESRFLLMSATLGDTSKITEQLEDQTGIEVSLVQSASRPVPLDFSYRDDPLGEVIEELIKEHRAPIYIVSFTQSQCANLAQSLTSVPLTDKAEKAEIKASLRGERFDSPYGSDIKRFLQHGIGLHHAGLLPRYRLLIERLAQEGRLKVICGTDTLGVGINVPIRSVLFTELSKFDGRKSRILTVRDFKQIAGRAGRKGFDDRGWVVCMAPPHMIENKALKRKAQGDPKKTKKLRLKKPPEGFVSWNEEKYQALIDDPAETLVPRFKIDFALLINLFQSDRAATLRGGGYRALVELVHASHLRRAEKRIELRRAKDLFQSLQRAGILELSGTGRGREVQLSEDLQRDFSMHHTQSLYLLYAIGGIEPGEEYAYQLLSLTEAILEDPRLILRKQKDAAFKEKLAELKGEGVEYEERMEILEKVTWPMPDKELIFESFDRFAENRPWALSHPVQPKSIARDMYMRCATFKEYVQLYQLKSGEGVLLRYLNQCYKALLQNVPEVCKDDQIHDIIAYLRATIRRADSSLLEAWTLQVRGAKAAKRLLQRLAREADAVSVERQDLADDPRAFRARIRAQLHQVVQALAARDYEEALKHIQNGSSEESEEHRWSEAALREALIPFYEEYQSIYFSHRARAHEYTLITPEEPRRWSIRQVILDDQGDNMWYLLGEVDLRGIETPEGPLVSLIRIES